MIGGFAGVGSPRQLISALANAGAKNLTIISVASTPSGMESDLAPLFNNGQVAKFIGSNVSASHQLMSLYKAGIIDVELYPMGNWIEKVRAGGAGLGGVLTPVGINTVMSDARDIVNIQGRQYLLELPLRADFALIKAYRADSIGNLEYRAGAINSHQVIAMAAHYTIAEVNEIVEVGQIEPVRVGTPGIFVQALVQLNQVSEQQGVLRHLWQKREEDKQNDEVQLRHHS